MGVPRFWELFHSGLVTVHRDEITMLSGDVVQLKSGQQITTDYCIFCTGWDDGISLFSPEASKTLGIPTEDETTSEEAASQDAAAEARILSLFPGLRNPPQSESRQKKKQRAWRLYRRVISPTLASSGDRSIIFLGQIHTLSTAMLSEIQALWGVAFLLGKVSIPDLHTMEQEVADWNAWSRRRYLDQGRKVPYSIYDFLSVSTKTKSLSRATISNLSHKYIDTLCRDLGIKTNRKSNFYKELFEPYSPRDYRGIIEEWQKHLSDKKEAKLQSLKA